MNRLAEFIRQKLVPKYRGEDAGLNTPTGEGGGGLYI